mgnify:FL=1
MLSVKLSKAIDCAYTVEGSGEPLILIHGIGASRDAWRFLVPVLEQHFTVVTYDLRGHGVSPLLYGEFGLDELVADLEKLRQTLGYEKVHLAGHSLGGMIGPRYALCFPERVMSLGLLSTAAGRTENDSAKVWGVVKAMEEQGIEDILGTLTNRWFTDAFMEQRPDLVERRLQQVLSTDAEVFMNVFRIYAGTEMMPWLHKVCHPSLIITGEFDGGCNPRLNKLIDEAMPDSHLIILPGLKHSILAEAGEQVALKMVSFLQALT